MKKTLPMAMLLILCTIVHINVYAHDYAMSFLYGGTNTQYINCVQNANGVLDSVSPDYFEINADGGLKTGKIDRHFITAMHDKGVQVIPFISNYWDRKLGQAALDHAEILTTEIARAVYEYNLDGVNVDIENISEKQKDEYTYFVASLRHKMPGRILSVSVAANPYDWQTGWHGSYDYKRLADNSDYLFVMAYDESHYGSKPGPVASSGFTEKSIEYALKQVAPEKIVLGIPFFGRYWKQGEAIGGHGLTAMDVNNLINLYENSKTFHDDTQSAQVMLTIKPTDTPPRVWGGRTLDSGVYEIWYDDMQSTAYKLSLVNLYGLKGSGSWALGQDTREMWDAYAQYKAGTAIQATPAPTIQPLPATNLQNTTSQNVIPEPSTAYTPSVPSQPPIPAAAYGSELNLAGQTNNQFIPRPTTYYWVTKPTEPGSATRAGNAAINTTFPQPTAIPEYTPAPIPIPAPIISSATTQPSASVPMSIPTPSPSLAGAPTSATMPAMPVPVVLSDEARLAISRGWLSNNSFDENRFATHGDAVTMIMKMAALLPDSYTIDHFTDTVNHPDGAYIRKAREYGIATGEIDGCFYPDRPLSRQDFVLYLDRVFNLPDTVNFESGMAKDLQRENNGDRYFAVQKFLAHGIVETDAAGNFYPYRTVTMGELARAAFKLDGCGIKNLKPLQYEGQPQRRTIIEPR